MKKQIAAALRIVTAGVTTGTCGVELVPHAAILLRELRNIQALGTADSLEQEHGSTEGSTQFQAGYAMVLTGLEKMLDAVVTYGSGEPVEKISTLLDRLGKLRTQSGLTSKSKSTSLIVKELRARK